MKFENAFVVQAPIEDAWAIILNVPEIAPCFPGASLTEQIDEDTYKGAVSLRLGPLSLAFRGTAVIAKRDAVNHAARVTASGTDSKGRGQAKAEATFRLVPDAAGTRVEISTDLNLTGAVAQYGRGAMIMQEVAAGLIDQFETRLNQRIAGSVGGHEAPNAPADAAEAQGFPTGASPTARSAAAASSVAAERGDAPAGAQTAAAPAEPAANAIGAGLIWRIVLRVLRRMIGR